MPSSMISDSNNSDIFPAAVSTVHIHAPQQSQFLPPSPADSTMVEALQPTRMSDEDRLIRSIDRGAPGDAAIFSGAKTPEQRALNKRKSAFYSDAFAQRESNSSARERVGRDSVVMAEVRTNVIVHDEYTFITDLSYNLSSRYQRPESSILVTVTHSACLIFAGSFDPAYTMTITALPSQLQPVTNKRNATLLQKGMEEALGVPSSRGIIKFVAIAEENLARNGKTVLGEIEDLQKEVGEPIARPGSSASKAKKRVSMKSMKSSKRHSAIQLKSVDETTPPPSDDGRPPLPSLPFAEVRTENDRKAEQVKKMGRRKSFIAAVFGKS